MALSLQKRVRNIARFRDIMSVLAAHGFDQLVDQLDLEERAVIRNMIKPRKEEKTVWRRIGETLEELGPTFVKLGQILSTRPDLMPEDLTQELRKLQTNVRPERFEAIRTSVESALGDELDALFQEFSEKPLAAASMAQVHRATLKDGRAVVVKVLRPGIREVVENDVDILYLLAGLAERIPDLRLLQPRAVVREFDRAMIKELDLTHELSNIRRFQENFRGDDHVLVPAPVEELCARTVLTMEYLEGVPFNEYAKVGADRERIAARAVAAVFKMVFEDGFFHADPHPGNVLALSHDRIGILDMGLAGRLDRHLRDKVVTLLAALVRDDPDRIAEAVFAFGDPKGPVDFSAFRKGVLELYEDELRGKSIRDVRLGRIFTALLRISDRHKMALPTDLTLMFKAVVTMEGVAKEVYPELDVLEEARPFVKRLLLERYSPERLSGDMADLIQSSHGLLRALPRRLDRLLGDLEQGRLVIRVEEADARRAGRARERAAARTALGIGSGGFALAGALLVGDYPVSGVTLLLGAVPLLLWTLFAAVRPRAK